MKARDRNHHGGKGGVREDSSDEDAIRAGLRACWMSESQGVTKAWVRGCRGALAEKTL